MLKASHPRCKLWLQAIGQEDLVYLPIEKLHELKFVCALHPHADFNEKENRLTKLAVPSLLLPYPPLREEGFENFPLHVGWKRNPFDNITKNKIPSGEHNYSRKEHFDHTYYKPHEGQGASATVSGIKNENIVSTSKQQILASSTVSSIASMVVPSAPIQKATYAPVQQKNKEIDPGFRLEVDGQPIQSLDAATLINSDFEVSFEDNTQHETVYYLVEPESTQILDENTNEQYTLDNCEDNDVEMTEISIYGDNGDDAISINSTYTDDGKVPVIQDLQHEGFSCNECHEDIHGFRYVCLECIDFDLCSACESHGVHDEHYVLRIPAPRTQKEIGDLIKSLKALVSNARCLTNVDLDDDLISIKKEEEQEIDMACVAADIESEYTYTEIEDPLLPSTIDQTVTTSTCTNDQFAKLPSTIDQTTTNSKRITDQLPDLVGNRFGRLEDNSMSKIQLSRKSKHKEKVHPYAMIGVNPRNATEHRSNDLQDDDDGTVLLNIVIDDSKTTHHKAKTKDAPQNLGILNQYINKINQKSINNAGIRILKRNREHNEYRKLKHEDTSRQDSDCVKTNVKSDIRVCLSRLSQAEIEIEELT